MEALAGDAEANLRAWLSSLPNRRADEGFVLLNAQLAQRDAAVRAEAWDEGERAGMQNHSAYQNTGAPAHTNPYRIARTTGGDR